MSYGLASASSSLFQAKDRTKSRALPSKSQLRALADENPLLIFKKLADSLVESHVPGPRLLRLQLEFEKIASGRTFQVFAIADEYRERIQRLLGDPRASIPRQLKRTLPWLCSVVVKRSFEDAGSSLPRSQTDPQQLRERSTLGRQLSNVQFEIQALTRTRFAHHENVVKLVGWGLCLDTLEDAAAGEPRIPLLILERAEFSLRQFLESEPTQYETLRAICLDIGLGLDAIHKENWVHGDLKFDNVLLFRHSSVSRYRAKVSDFGLAQPQTQEGEMEPYLGSYGWAPLEGSTRLQQRRLRDLQQCDVYAYGLMVWSIFAGSSSPPLPPEFWQAQDEDASMYSERQLYYTAIKELERECLAPREEINRIILVLRNSLHGDPRLLRRNPWTYFRVDRYPSIPRVDDAATILMTVAYATDKAWQEVKLTWNSFIDKHLLSFPELNVTFPSRLRQSYRSLSQPVRFPVSTTFEWGWLQKSHDEPRSPRQRAVERLCAELEASINPGKRVTIKPDDIQPLTHQGTRHFNLSILKSNFQKFNKLTEKARNDGNFLSLDALEADFYANARLRSRFPHCCWDNPIPLEYGSHHVAFPKFLLSQTAAWLFRGPIGEQELEESRWLSTRSILWSYLFEDKPGASKSKLEELVLTIRLLTEKELSVDERITHKRKTKSVWQLFLETFMANPAAKAHGSSLLSGLIRYLLHTAASTAGPEYRYFLTGTGKLAEAESTQHLEANGRVAVSTILHESVLAHCYTAVECIVLEGFPVNARGEDGRFAIQLAFDFLQAEAANDEYRYGSTRVEDQSLQDERIFSLLEQNSIWTRADLAAPDGSDIPLGWNAADLSSTRQEDLGTDGAIFCEKHFGGVTFKRPTFSLFQDRNLALGYRTRTADGQTYHMDLLRLLEQAPQPLRNPTQEQKHFTEQWYRNDVKIVRDQKDTPVVIETAGRGRWKIRSVGPFWRQQRQRARPLESYQTTSLSASESTPLLSASHERSLRQRQAVSALARNCLTLLGAAAPTVLAAVGYRLAWHPILIVALATGAVIVASWYIRSFLFVALRGSSGASAATLVDDANCLFELFICFSTLARFSDSSRGALFINYMTIGYVVGHSSLRLGMIFLANGIRHVEFLFNETTTNLKAHLLVIGTISAILAVGPKLLFTKFEDIPFELPRDGKHILLVRVSAIVCMCYFVFDLFFQHRSHALLYDDISYDEELEDSNEEIQAPSRLVSISNLFVLVPVLGLGSDVLILALTRTSPYAQAMAATFVVPLACHAPAFLHSISRSYGDDENTIIAALSGVRTMLLFVQPAVVLFSGRLWFAPYSGLSLIDSSLILIVLWVLTVLLKNGKGNYLDGAMLLGL